MHASGPETQDGHAAPPDTGHRDRGVVAILLVSAFVAILNETVMAVALPHLMTALDVAPRDAQWLTTAFMLTMAVVIPLTGYLIQRFSTRPAYLLAMSLFCTGTLVCGLAPGLPVLVAGRVIQAAGAAILLPLLMTTIMTVVPPASRGAFMGRISIVISVAPAIGPTLAGLVLSVLEWRWIFLLLLPVALAAFAFGARRIGNVSAPGHASLDVASVALSAVGFGALVYGLSLVGEPHGGSAGMPAWLPMLVGALAIAAFAWRQRRLQARDAALLDLRTFASPVFRTAAIVMSLLVMAMFGVFILLPMLLQSVLGLSALQTGLLLLPGGLAMGLGAPKVGALFDRHGARVLVLPGAATCTAALCALAWLPAAAPAWGWLVAHVVLCLGLALVFTPLFTAGLGALPPGLYAHGSAIVGTSQQVAGAAGTALFVAVMSARAGDAPLAAGASPAATAAGIQLAFAIGAGLALCALAWALRLPKGGAPADAGHAPPA